MNNALSIGTWLSVGSPAIAELAALCGLDWVLIDLEHGCAAEAAVPDQLRALRGSRTMGIVRVGAPHADLIARVLDWGARGIMVPHVNSPAEAERIVRAAHYAPRGQRGYSRTVRAHDYGLRSPDETAAPLIFAQIETVEGVNRCSEIARVAGVDVLFVGPADLQHDLKHHTAAPADLAQCLDVVVAAATTAGKAAGILVRDPADVGRHRQLGFTHIAVDSDLAILRKAWQQTVAKLREQP
jgi:2-keto-3-deoxy-L-rhamnonate aldolase RhmA